MPICSRREILGLIAASAVVGTLKAGAESVSPHGGVLAPWKPGELKIHLIHTGVGECQFLVFPDGTTMMIDCGDHAAMTRLFTL